MLEGVFMAQVGKGKETEGRMRGILVELGEVGEVGEQRYSAGCWNTLVAR